MARQHSTSGPGRVRPGGPDARAVAALVGLLVVMAAASVALALRGAHLVRGLPSPRVETYLELPVVAAGALAATWVAASCALALGCVGLRATGRTWVAGERFVARRAPALVRRVARVGVTMTVGAGLVLVTGTAHASEPVDDPAPVAVELGWRTSASDPGAAPADGERSADHQSADATDAGMPTTMPSAPVETSPPGPPPATEPLPQGAAHGAPTAAEAPGRAEANSPAASPPASRAGASAKEQDARPAVPTRAAGVQAAGAALAAERDAALTTMRDVAETRSEVVVLRGDTLWSIAARALPADATDREIATEVERWYAANVDVVGDDPDLIRPGQVLVAPTA